MHPGDCLCFNLRKASRAVSRAYDEALAPFGLKNTQFSLLAVLNGRGPSSVSDLAEAMVMERTTLTRNLRPLERDGLVGQEPGADRRQRLVHLTPAGARLLAKVMPHWRRAQGEMHAVLGATRGERMLRDLRSTTGALA